MARTSAHAAPPANRAHVVGDALTMAWRNLLNIRRNPELLVFATIQPVIFVVMFRYVFGGAIQGSLPAGQTYINFLMPGVFVQTIVFGALTTGVGLADDLNKGLIDRFRSLPMARSAVLVGRTLADLVRNFFVVLLMCVVGFIVGWTIGTNVWGLLGCIVIILAFSYSLSWVFAIVGLSVKDAETAQAVSFPILALLVFASSAFVPVATMPSWLQPWAKNQPVSVVVERRPSTHHRRSDQRLRGEGDRLDRRHRRGVRADRGRPLPQGHVTRLRTTLRVRGPRRRRPARATDPRREVRAHRRRRLLDAGRDRAGRDPAGTRHRWSQRRARERALRPRRRNRGVRPVRLRARCDLGPRADRAGRNACSAKRRSPRPAACCSRPR